MQVSGRLVKHMAKVGSSMTMETYTKVNGQMIWLMEEGFTGLQTELPMTANGRMIRCTVQTE